jgi:hypothetical protein
MATQGLPKQLCVTKPCFETKTTSGQTTRTLRGRHERLGARMNHFPDPELVEAWAA